MKLGDAGHAMGTAAPCIATIMKQLIDAASVQGLNEACATFLVACGGSPSAPPPTDAAATITITAAGVSPRDVRFPLSSCVQFVNEDTRPHAVSPHPVDTRTDCPPVNEVGPLPPGQRRTTGRLTNLRYTRRTPFSLGLILTVRPPRHIM